MYTDLFRALRNPQNPRGHPILAALLYAFCPAAARWWIAGADPVVPFDPVWRALEDLSGSDKTLKDALEEHGFGGLIEDVKAYIAKITAYRKRHPEVVAPERLPLFTGGRIELSKRHLFHAAIQKLDGNWENFFTYIRTWAFIIGDWEAEMRFFTPATLELQELSLIVSGVRRSINFPAWVWGAKVGRANRIVAGLLVSHGQRDPLRFLLAQQSSPQGDQPWASPLEIWAVDPLRGSAEPFGGALEAVYLAKTIERLAYLAKNGPHPPLVALNQSQKCAQCGYQAQCYQNKHINQLALNF